MTEIDHNPGLDIDLEHVGSSTDVAQAIVTNTDADLTGLSLRDESEGVGGESLSPFRLALRHYKRNRVAMVALIVLAVIVLACLFPSIPARYGETERLPKTATTYINSPPSAEAWLAPTTNCILQPHLLRRRISIMIGIAVAPIACTVGTIVGVSPHCGGARRHLDENHRCAPGVLTLSHSNLRNVLADPCVNDRQTRRPAFMVILLSAVGDGRR